VPSGAQEPTLGYHSDSIGTLTSCRNPAMGQWQSGSLTGAVAIVLKPDYGF